MIQHLSAWNTRLNGLPRKLTLVALTFGAAAAALWIIPYLWPFAAAFLFSRILEPFVRTAAKGFSRFSCRKRRVLATVIGMILLFGLAGAAASVLIRWLWQELNGFIRSLPQLLEWFNSRGIPALLSLYQRFSILLPDHLREAIAGSLVALGQAGVRWAASFSGWITSGAWNTAASIPHVLLSVVLTITGTYYMTADRERIADFFHRTFPLSITKRSRLIRANLWKALAGQLRSQATISLVVMFFLMLALGISGVRYGAVIGMLIGIADALPLLGAGLFLVPWCLISFLTGQNGLGITLACLYAIAIVIRQILEPKLIGRHLGMYPLAAMIAMYAGYRLLGFIGLLLGPIAFMLAKAVLDADEAARQVQP